MLRYTIPYIGHWLGIWKATQASHLCGGMCIRRRPVQGKCLKCGEVLHSISSSMKKGNMTSHFKPWQHPLSSCKSLMMRQYLHLHAIYKGLRSVQTREKAAFVIGPAFTGPAPSLRKERAKTQKSQLSMQAGQGIVVHHPVSSQCSIHHALATALVWSGTERRFTHCKCHAH